MEVGYEVVYIKFNLFIRMERNNLKGCKRILKFLI